jgi:Ni/Co efflux regulator RcnB
MAYISSFPGRTLAFAVAAAIAAGPVLADKPSWAGEKGGKHDRGGHERDRQYGEAYRHAGPAQGMGHFAEQHRSAVHAYYSGRFKAGRCPPGLETRHDGCVPRGQARQWQLGRPLPRETIYYALPSPLLLQLGPAPAGYRYVRVASDILLIAIGTGMVMDAIEDIGR